jgi:hypothetical protein
VDRPLDVLVQELSQAVPASEMTSEAFTVLARVADLTILQLSLYMKQNDALKRHTVELQTLLRVNSTVRRSGALLCYSCCHYPTRSLVPLRH